MKDCAWKVILGWAVGLVMGVILGGFVVGRYIAPWDASVVQGRFVDLADELEEGRSILCGGHEIRGDMIMGAFDRKDPFASTLQVRLADDGATEEFRIVDCRVRQ